MELINQVRNLTTNLVFNVIDSDSDFSYFRVFDTIMMLVQMVQYSRLKTKVHALYHVTVDVPRTMSWKSFFDEDEAVITPDEEANVISGISKFMAAAGEGKPKPPAKPASAVRKPRAGSRYST